MDKRKLHLVKWSTVTKLKKTGGLGIREARHANITLLAKVGGQMVAGIDKVWTCVLDAKYVNHSYVLSCPRKNTDSQTWKGIVKSNALVSSCYGCRVGNGTYISLWFDIWVKDEPLCLEVNRIEPDEINRKVTDIIPPQGA